MQGAKTGAGYNRYKWMVLSVVGVGSFLGGVDNNVVNIAVPMIQQHYGASIGAVEWVVMAYLLAVSSLLLICGRLGDMWGYKNVYVAGYGMFALGRLVSGLAPSLGWLIGGRVVQGMAGAMLMALSPALITTSFPAAERGRALGLQATLTYCGLALGPSLGGWISGRFGWQWIFLALLPAAVLGGLFAVLVLRPTEERSRQQFDLAGAGLFAAGLLAVLLALSHGESWGWGSPAVIGLLAGGAGLLALFVRQEGRTHQPMLPLGLFRNPVISAGVAAAYFHYAVVFSIIFMVPYYLQRGLGMDPQRTGLILTVQPLVMVSLAATSGWLSDRLGVRGPATAGMILVATGAALLARTGVALTTPYLVGALAVTGMGVGLFTAPNNSAIMGAAPPDRQGITAGLLAEARVVGMVSGVAVSVSLFAFLLARLERAGLPTGDAMTVAFHRTMLLGAALALVGAVLSMVRPAARGPRGAG